MREYAVSKGVILRSVNISFTIKYSIYKTSFKCSQLIRRIYRVLLGEEDLPTSERSKFFNNKSYTDKVYNKAIDDMIKDIDR